MNTLPRYSGRISTDQLSELRQNYAEPNFDRSSEDQFNVEAFDFGQQGDDQQNDELPSDDQPHILRQNVRRNLTCSSFEGSCHASMVGLSETYFAAFYIAVGLSDFSVGLLATIPYLLGSALQLLTPWGVKRVRSYRTWAMGTAALQGFSLLALAMLALYQQVAFGTLLAVVTIYWASSLAIGPAWNTWIEFVVPKKVRARYFSRRMRLCQLFLIAGIASGGLLLRSFSDSQQQMLVFVGLFALGGILRLISVGAFRMTGENRSWLAENVASSLRIGEGPDVGQLLKSVLPFFIAMQFAVYVSGPYFAPFMLKTMGLDYAQFMVLILLGFFGRVLILPWSGRIAQKFGPGKLMLWGAIGIVPMSTLWLGYHSFWWLCLIQLSSGATWACYELAMSLVFIERIPSHHRVRVLSWFNTFNGLAMVGGAMLGGLILTQMENSVAGFLTLFILSGIFRIVAFYWFPFGLVGIKSAVEMPRAIASQMSSPLLNGRSILRPFFVTSTNRKIGNSSRRV